jgi:hypothetical protein
MFHVYVYIINALFGLRTYLTEDTFLLSYFLDRQLLFRFHFYVTKKICLNYKDQSHKIHIKFVLFSSYLTLSDPTSNLVRQYDFPVSLRCRKTSDTVFVAFVRPLSEPLRPFSSCSTDFSQQIAQVVLFLFFYVFLF